MGALPPILAYAVSEQLGQKIASALSANYQVYIVIDLPHAYDLFEREHFDLVLAEFRELDVMDNACAQFISRVRTHPTKANTLVLLISTIPHLANLFTDISPAAILRTPFDSDQLRQFVAMHMGR